MNRNCVAFRLSICCSTELTGRVCASPLYTYTSILMRLRIVAILYARTYTQLFSCNILTHSLWMCLLLWHLWSKKVCVCMHGQWAYVLKDTHTHNYYYNLLFQPYLRQKAANCDEWKSEPNECTSERETYKESEINGGRWRWDRGRWAS